MTSEHIKQKLSERGLKTTHQRFVVFQVLSESRKHPTAEEIFDIVRINNPTVSLGTVYKTLETFVENELIAKVSTPGGKTRYDIHTDSHSHIYCTNTDEIIDYMDEELNSFLEDYIKRKSFGNFNVKDIRLHIRGEKQNPDKDIVIN